MAGIDTEAALAALFDLTAPLGMPTGSPPVGNGTFKTRSRRLLFVEDIGAEKLPAVFQNQIARNDEFAFNQLTAAIVDVEWYVYCFQGNQDAPSTPILNPLVDTLLNQLPPVGPLLRVGGVVMPVSRAGPMHYFEGLLGERAVARIPLRLRVLPT